VLAYELVQANPNCYYNILLMDPDLPIRDGVPKKIREYFSSVKTLGDILNLNCSKWNSNYCCSQNPLIYTYASENSMTVNKEEKYRELHLFDGCFTVINDTVIEEMKLILNNR
jgi:hypothetical protein